MTRSFTLVTAVTISLLLTGCAEVGSERWCQNMEDRPKGEWTMSEASDYSKHCLFRSKSKD